MQRYLARLNILLLWLILSVTVLPLLWQSAAIALALEKRSINLASPTASASTEHKFTFDYPSTDTVGSIEFLYCTDPLPSQPCTAPTGMDAGSANLSNQTGETGFVLAGASGNRLLLSRTPAPASLVTATYTFSPVVNPSVKGTFYVRISTYASTDGSGPVDHKGSVVSSVTQGVGISTEVPPILTFCVGQSISGLCDTAAGNFLQLGQLRSNSTASAVSQMMGGTNADFGYIVTANGATMTSGSNTLSALSSPSPSQTGQSQFGINLRANTVPPQGSEPSGSGVAAPTNDYSIPNRFKFVNGDIVARSTEETDYVKFTVTYIVNIPVGQAPGIYSTTLTYICVATF